MHGICILIGSTLLTVLTACSSLSTTSYLPFSSSPQIVAHRGGTADAPENTLYAIQLALEHGADIIWLSVQVTQDGIPVLYRPADLSLLTNGHGKVREKRLSELQNLNAGYHFKKTLSTGEVIFPFRNHPLSLPTLREALQKIPPQIPIFLDMKESSPFLLVPAIAKVLEDLSAWKRIRLYSTQSSHIQMWKTYPKARYFEERETTRQRLVDLMLGNASIPPPPGTWVGIELERPVEITENFTLGKGVSKAVAHWWTPLAIQCHRKRGRVYIVLFGIDQKASYRQAKRLGVDAVMTDSPALFAQKKCPAYPHPLHAQCSQDIFMRRSRLFHTFSFGKGNNY